MKNSLLKISMLTIALTFLFACDSNKSQEDKSKRASPPNSIKTSIDGKKLAFHYSSPQVKGRKIWGGLVPFNQVWRTGANEANVLDVSSKVIINNSEIPKGRYSLFTIPGTDTWTIILNQEWDQWGAYNYDATKDILRLEVKPQITDKHHEKLTFQFSKSGGLHFFWEQLTFSFQIESAAIH